MIELREVSMRSHLGMVMFTAALAATPIGLSLASGGGSPNGGNGMVTAEGAMRNRGEAAKAAYVSAVRTVNAAKDYESDAAKAATTEKSAKAQAKSQKYYQEALTKFIDVVGLDPKMYQAWNYLGFTNRKL